MSLWSAQDAAAATGGRAAGWQAGGVSIDTREMRPGDLFVALRDRRDGHAFVAAALEAGAAAAMVERVPDGVDPARLLVVADAMAGLAALGLAGRMRTTAQVVGITGSAGKTSAKGMLAVALGHLRVHAAERSFNNHWGVPLTLARTPRDAEVAAVEIGMNAPGEIAPLSRLAGPDVALVTNVGAAHLAAFASVDDIAREKASIARGLRPGGAMVLPADSPHLAVLRAGAGDARVLTFGEAVGADLRLVSPRIGPEGSEARVVLSGAEVPLRLSVPGRHHLTNAAGVLGVVHALGRDVAAAAEALARWVPPGGRGTREALRLPGGPVTLVDEAFNANPASVSAALAVLASAPGRRVAVLGDMLELGPEEERLHAALARDPAMAEIHRVHCLGPRMRALHAALPAERRGAWAETPEAMAAALVPTLERGDTVMVKGSKGIGASRVVDALRALGQGAGAGDVPRAAHEAAPTCSTG